MKEQEKGCLGFLGVLVLNDLFRSFKSVFFFFFFFLVSVGLSGTEGGN